jgi:hypothetical protein
MQMILVSKAGWLTKSIYCIIRDYFYYTFIHLASRWAFKKQNFWDWRQRIFKESN